MVFVITRTIIVAIPMPIALTIVLETARAGQVPRTSLKTGFSLTNPFEKVSKGLTLVFAISVSPLFYQSVYFKGGIYAGGYSA